MNGKIDNGVIDDGVPVEDFKPLTAEQARELRERLPQVRPVDVLLIQLVVGVLSTIGFGLFSHRWDYTFSALYGALSVVVPQGLLVINISRTQGLIPGVVAARFLMWELIKIFVSALLLGLASFLVPNIQWPVLLVVMVLCMKVHWFAPLIRRKPLNSNQPKDH